MLSQSLFSIRVRAPFSIPNIPLTLPSYRNITVEGDGDDADGEYDHDDEEKFYPYLRSQNKPLNLIFMRPEITGVYDIL